MHDMNDQKFELDSVVVYPLVSGNMPYIRVGKVVEIIPPKTPGYPERLRVEWFSNTGMYGRGTRTSIINHPARGLIITDPSEKMFKREQ